MHPIVHDALERLEMLHSGIRRDLTGIPSEALDWAPNSQMNSLSVLVVHLTGAERYWIGDVILGESSHRDRESEFRARGWEAGALLQRLDESLAYARRALQPLTVQDLEREVLSPRDGKTYRTAWALLHTLEHTALHCGHIQLTRQMWEQQAHRLALREVHDEDLPVFFEDQRDPEANHMAAFTAQDPENREAFDQHWARIRANENNLIRTIVYDGQIAGSVSSYVQEGEREVTYWIGRQFWGQGIASKALAAYLDLVPERPLYARVVKDNLGSLRVLEKCGFKIIGDDKGFANARGAEVEEYILRLDAA